ncbi:YceI family protein [Deinococcus sp. KNUC1210]|uniref:YceI family protein n=1 Tax=Deinococcus sp. KNUC1210 TaxID=2917691 RepID=UPI001EF01D54|nr:YceI family protein [Deinococcus sp. KNUC1210]ULH15960.1 YceI family protein [Deinococcus sp. KNUC1210]
MRLLSLPASATTLLLAWAASASAAGYGATGGSVRFDYRVTFIGVSGTSSDLSANVNLTMPDVWQASGTVSVKASSLKTGNSLQEDHMRGALGADRFPVIVYTLSGVNTGAVLTDGQTLATTGMGTLTLKGVTRSLSVPLKLTLSGERVNVATQFKFNPHDFGVDYFGGSDSIAINVGFVLEPR